MRHRFHAICPYFAMFPEAFAESWIDKLSKAGDVVLDPFSGRGTTAFQSLLMGRLAVACDVNDVAYCITRAKTHAPELSTLRRRLTILQSTYVSRKWLRHVDKMPEFYQVAYQRKTLSQILYLRDSLRWRESDTDCFLAALVLGALHGEMDKSPSYLSNQMPRTISTKPTYSIKYWRARGLVAPERDAFELLRTQAAYRYESDPPKGRALVVHQDMRRLSWMADDLPGPIGLVVTSPPYLDVTNFEEDQWLRLWFLGGPDHPTSGRLSRDDRHERPSAYWGFIADMWRMLGAIVAKKGSVVIRIGGRGTTPEDITKALAGTSAFARRPIRLVEQSVSEMKRRQTDAFHPGTKGCMVEIDCHFMFED